MLFMEISSFETVFSCLHHTHDCELATDDLLDYRTQQITFDLSMFFQRKTRTTLHCMSLPHRPLHEFVSSVISPIGPKTITTKM